MPARTLLSEFSKGPFVHERTFLDSNPFGERTPNIEFDVFLCQRPQSTFLFHLCQLLCMSILRANVLFKAHRLIQVTVLHIRQVTHSIYLPYSCQLSVDGIHVCLCNVG